MVEEVGHSAFLVLIHLVSFIALTQDVDFRVLFAPIQHKLDMVNNPDASRLLNTVHYLKPALPRG